MSVPNGDAVSGDAYDSLDQYALMSAFRTAFAEYDDVTALRSPEDVSGTVNKHVVRLSSQTSWA
jgi:hypothetical protein